SGAALGRYARLEGTVSGADTGAGTFSLCGSRTTFRHHRGGHWGRWGRGDRSVDADDAAVADASDDGSRCITVAAGTDVSGFTGAGAASFGDLVAGAQVTVFGRLMRSAGDDAFTMQAQVITLGEDFDYVRGTATSGYDAGSGGFPL